MHPVFARTSRLIVFVMAWALIGALNAGVFLNPARFGWGAALALGIPHAIVFGFISLSTWYVCRSTPLRRSQLTAAMINLAAAGVLSSALWFGVGLMLTALFRRFFGWADLSAHYREHGLLVFDIGLLLYALSVAINYIGIGLSESRHAERQVLSAQVLAKDAELRALRTQIDPHFLYNALNSISALTTVDPPAARRMCVLLSDYLRKSTGLGSRDVIPLADEVALALQYLDIEKVRFGARLSVETVWPPEPVACVVPPLLLQPLVENAITHGIAGLLDGGTIRLSIVSAGRRVTIIVENPREDGRRKPQTGVGLQNVRARLLAHFGPEGRLDVKETPERFWARVVVPAAETAPAGERT